MTEKTAKDMLKYIEKSPSPFHAVDNAAALLREAGYTELKETQKWRLAEGGSYYVVRNGSAVIALRIPKERSAGEYRGFHITASHSDSPGFKIKENPQMTVEDAYVKLNTDRYGGMILSTWLDRPLSVAGRILLRENGEAAGRIVSRLVNIDRDLLVIPNVAIHMNRDMNKGMEYNAQTDMLPLFGGSPGKADFLKLVAEAAHVAPGEILGHDLFLYVREKGRLIGAEKEFVLSPRLDDLQCVFASIRAMSETAPREYVNLCAVFDNEEVGSTTRQGADSTFLSDVLVRICEELEISKAEYRRMLADSLLLSADNAHAVHPNHPEKADPTNRPLLNGGIVIKYHGSQKYATDAYTAAVTKELCRRAGVPWQTYANRSDIAGGSTLGNLSEAQVSMPAVDIGLPQLAMHSAVETAGMKDTEYAVRLLRTFYAE